MKILINGPLNTTHSVSLVNQFQLIEMQKERQYHQISIHSQEHNWPLVEPGFDEHDKFILNSYLTAIHGEKYDIEYSMGGLQKFNSTLKFNFFVTEFGNNIGKEGEGLKEALVKGEEFIVPSTWVLNRINEKFTSDSKISIIPHGYNPKYYFRMDEESRKIIRSKINIKNDEHVFMNTGAQTWNKGVDLLLIAFSKLREKYKNIKLILKDSSNLYKNNMESVITNLHKSGKITAKAIESIISSPGHLDFEKLNYLYNAADTYISPYRAEGFNIPVLESMAAGCRIIVTKNGATDDYVINNEMKIDSDIVADKLGTYLNPNVDSLINKMNESIINPMNSREGYENLRTYEYSHITNRLINLMLEKYRMKAT